MVPDFEFSLGWTRNTKTDHFNRWLVVTKRWGWDHTWKGGWGGEISLRLWCLSEDEWVDWLDSGTEWLKVASIFMGIYCLQSPHVDLAPSEAWCCGSNIVFHGFFLIVSLQKPNDLCDLRSYLSHICPRGKSTLFSSYS